MNSIIRKIEALETDSNVGLMISKDAVLEIVKDAIAFEIQPGVGERAEPTDELDLITWATLDTALHVLALGVAKINLIALRESFGVENVFTDDEILAQATEQLGRPATLASVARCTEAAGRLLYGVFNKIVDDTAEAISESFRGAP